MPELHGVKSSGGSGEMILLYLTSSSLEMVLFFLIRL